MLICLFLLTQSSYEIRFFFFWNWLVRRRWFLLVLFFFIRLCINKSPSDYATFLHVSFMLINGCFKVRRVSGSNHESCRSAILFPIAILDKLQLRFSLVCNFSFDVLLSSDIPWFIFSFAISQIWVSSTERMCSYDNSKSSSMVESGGDL